MTLPWFLSFTYDTSGPMNSDPCHSHTSLEDWPSQTSPYFLPPTELLPHKVQRLAGFKSLTLENFSSKSQLANSRTLQAEALGF